MSRPSRYGRAGGLTLVEVLIVLTIVAVASGGVIVSFREVTRATSRGAAARLGASIRYLYDHAVVTGKYYRLAIDLDKGTYRAERSDDRFYLVSGKEKSPGGGKAFDADEETKRLDDEERQVQDNLRGIAQQLQPPPMLKRAHFESFRDAMLPEVALRGAWIRDVYTPRQKEPYTAGKALLYFFPDGHTERAVIHVVAGKRPSEEEEERDAPREDQDVYTLIVHPLTGKVELKVGDISPPASFDDSSDQGDAEGGS